MAKKSFTDAASASAAAFNSIVNAGAQNTQETKEVQDSKGTQDVKEVQDAQDAFYVHPAQDVQKPKKQSVNYVRLNFKLPAKYKEYLQAAAYRESSPVKMVSVTEYLCRIIDKDMEEHNYKGLENEKENTNS